MSTLLSWPALVLAVLLAVTPLLLVIRRSHDRRIALLGAGANAARPPMWAVAASFVSIPLLFLGARGLAGSADPWLYVLGAAGVILLIQFGLVRRHDKQARSP
jgi:hypothetical protein